MHICLLSFNSDTISRPRLIQRAVSAAWPILAKSSSLAVEPLITVSLLENFPLDTSQYSKPVIGEPTKSLDEVSVFRSVSNPTLGFEKTGASSVDTLSTL